MFVQYNLNDPNPTAAAIQAATMSSVDAGALSAAGRAQLEVPDGTNLLANTIDTTQSPPVLVPIAG